MADVFLEHSDLEISKEEVRECTDVDLLTSWLNEQNEVSQEIAIMIGALKHAPHADTTRLARKLGYVNMSKAWIQRRLGELGVDDERVTVRHPGARDPNDRIASLKRHLEGMEIKLRERNATIKAQNIELTSLRGQVQAFQRKAEASLEAMEARHG